MRDNYSDSGWDGSKYQGEVGEPEEAWTSGEINPKVDVFYQPGSSIDDLKQQKV